MSHYKEKLIRNEFPREQEFYNLNRLLSLEADVSMCSSIRDVGKSYDMRKKCHKAILSGYSCVWLRWQRNELGTAIDSWTKQFPDQYEDVTPKGNNVVYRTYKNYESNTYIVFASVKDSVNVKDIQIPNLYWLCYDECVPEQYDVRTRRDVEFDKFTSIYMSFRRTSKTLRAVLMCNVIDWFNPFTRGYGITPFESGYIKVFLEKLETRDSDGNVTTTYLKVAYENIKPSAKMLDRVLELAKLRYTNSDELQKYINNATGKDYTMIGKCPDMSIELADIQFRRGDHYYSYRVHNGVYYFVETKKREIQTEVFKFGTNGHLEGRRPEIGKIIEGLINNGMVRFENGHVFNDIMAGLADYRMRNGI